MQTYNAARGEVPLTIAGIELVIAAEMFRLATLSQRSNCQSFGELYAKLVNCEIMTVILAVEVLSIRGDHASALKAITIADLPACKDAFVAAMLHHVGSQEGKGEAVKENQATGLGGNGMELQ